MLKSKSIYGVESGFFGGFFGNTDYAVLWPGGLVLGSGWVRIYSAEMIFSYRKIDRGVRIGYVESSGTIGEPGIGENSGIGQVEN